MLKYCHYESQAKFVFIVYGVLFFITRMVVYPFYLLYSAVFLFPVTSTYPPAYWVFITALSLTQVKTGDKWAPSRTCYLSAFFCLMVIYAIQQHSITMTTANWLVRHS